MNILLKFFLICFLIVNLISCASQNGKVVVEGASGEVISSIEEGDKAINEDNKNISIEDDLSETAKINKLVQDKRLDILDIPIAIEANKTHLIDILLSEVTSIFFL